MHTRTVKAVLPSKHDDLESMWELDLVNAWILLDHVEQWPFILLSGGRVGFY